MRMKMRLVLFVRMCDMMVYRYHDKLHQYTFLRYCDLYFFLLEMADLMLNFKFKLYNCIFLF